MTSEDASFNHSCRIVSLKFWLRCLFSCRKKLIVEHPKVHIVVKLIVEHTKVHVVVKCGSKFVNVRKKLFFTRKQVKVIGIES